MKIKIMLTCLILPSLLVASTLTFDADKHAKIEQLIKLSGSTEQINQMMDQIYLQYEQMMPEVPHQVWDIMREEFNGDMINGLMRSMIPIYAKHYSMEDIQGQIDFYESPTGRSMVEKLPAMSQEIAVISAQWGHQLSERLVMRLEKLEEEMNAEEVTDTSSDAEE